MNSAEPIKFYILVPTRERPDTLIHCLRTIIAQDYRNFEIIVSDNFSQDNTKQVVTSLNDDRISYTNTGKRIGMSNNFEHALSHINSGWVTILGDDDGLLPGALGRIEEIIQNTETEAINSTWCQYFWPGCTSWDSTLTIPFGQGWEKRKSAVWLSRLMKGEAEYPELPMLYTGNFVSSSAINRARDHEGKFYKSVNPDVYSAIAIASVLEDYIHLNEPVAIAGISAHSNGASCLGIGNSTQQAEKFFSENTLDFHPVLGGPKVKSLPISVYESYLQALFLHKDRLNIDLTNQLSLAIVHASIDHKTEIIAYCEAVAKKNSIETENILEKAKTLKRRYDIKSKIRKLNRFFTWFISLNSVTYKANTLGVKNVFDASLAARAMWANQVDSKNWRTKKLFGALRRRLCKNKPLPNSE